MIPRTIHLIWFQGADQVPAKYLANIRRLRSLNPTWEVRVWSDEGLRAAAAALGVAEAYDAATVMHQKIDFGRYCVLYIHGGITIDMDTWALRPLDSLPALHGIDRLTVSMAPANSLESAVLRRRCIRLPGATQLCSYVNNACLLAPPQDPALMHIIRACSEKLLDPPSGAWGKELLVNGTTGPDRVNHVVSRLPAGMVTVLPSAYFEPCFGYDPYCVVPPQAILAHQCDGTWVSGGLRRGSRAWYHVRHHWALLALLAVGALLVFRHRRRRA